MRYWLVVLGVLGLVGSVPAAEHAGAMPKSITGEVVDVACYVGSGAHGAGHKSCAEACAKGGGSLGILQDKTNKLYIVVAPKPGGNPNAKLMDHISHKVQVTGPVSMRGGVNTIAVQTVKHISG
jgi:hypothetical protein